MRGNAAPSGSLAPSGSPTPDTCIWIGALSLIVNAWRPLVLTYAAMLVVGWLIELVDTWPDGDWAVRLVNLKTVLSLGVSFVLLVQWMGLFRF